MKGGSRCFRFLIGALFWLMVCLPNSFSDAIIQRLNRVWVVHGRRYVRHKQRVWSRARTLRGKKDGSTENEKKE